MRYFPSFSLSRVIYAISLIAFSSMHFLFNDFITGRAPAWPQGTPGQVVFAYISGLVLMASGIAIFSNTKPCETLALSGSLILIWAAFRNTYQLSMHLEYGGLLTNTLKGFAIGGGAFIVANTFVAINTSTWLTKYISVMAKAGIYMVSIFLFTGGIQHFIFADFVQYLVPTWIPGSLLWTYFTGLALIAAGLGLITGLKLHLTALLAAWMVFAWVVLLHIPRAIANQNQNEWVAAFEALSVSGILFVIAHSSSNK